MSKAPLAGVIVVAALALATWAAPAGAARAVARADHVRATLSWQQTERGALWADGIHVTIARRGHVGLRGAGVVRGTGWSNWMVFPPRRGFSPVRVVDLDGDGEPEVLVNVFSGGAYCCTETRIYRRRGSSYATSPLYDFGESGYRLRRFGQEVNLVGALPTWGIVGGPHGNSGYPIRVWRQTARGLRNVTRDRPALLADDARHWHRWWVRFRGEGYDTVGTLSAYVVDLDRLERTVEAAAAIDAADAAGELDDIGVESFRDAVSRVLQTVDRPRPAYFTAP